MQLKEAGHEPRPRQALKQQHNNDVINDACIGSDATDAWCDYSIDYLAYQIVGVDEVLNQQQVRPPVGPAVACVNNLVRCDRALTADVLD